MHPSTRLLGISLLASVLLSGCMAGGGGSVGLYAGTRGDVGIAFRGHASLLGFRVGREDRHPTAAPVFGVETGPAFSFRKNMWRLQANVPIGAATWEDLDAGHGIRVAPAFMADWGFNYDGDSVHEAYGGGASTAYLRHLSMDSERYEGRDAARIHRMGPVLSAAFMHDKEGWFGTFFLGLMYDYVAYIASGR